MLTNQDIALIKQTVPVLKNHGVELTRYFYQRMFTHNPELKHIFNQDHQHNDQQARALAMAVLAYAENIENLAPLLPAIERIANKHASVGIRREHYAIVGHHLLLSIKEVLGDGVSDELLAAWGKAYQQLADILINAENKLYDQAAQHQGGWSGWRPFKMAKKIKESDDVTSFYFFPSESGQLPAFLPGQYISVKRFNAEKGVDQIRQYTLSDSPNKPYLRISVKRETPSEALSGDMSHYLHDDVKEGDMVLLSHPFGDFYLDTNSSSPLVLISAGVGQTPMLSMLNYLLSEQSVREIAYLHAARNSQFHFMKQWVKEAKSIEPHMTTVTFYENPLATDKLGVDYDYEGRMDLTVVRELLSPQGEYYVCGPEAFILSQRDVLLAFGIPASQIHYEVFSTNALVV